MPPAAATNDNPMAAARQALEAALARFPLAISDMQAELDRGNDALGQLAQTTDITFLEEGGHHVILAPPMPGVDQKCRQHAGPDRTLLRVFDSAFALAFFLQQPGAVHIVNDANWHPLLLQTNDNTSLQAFISERAPHEWPWALTTHSKVHPLQANLLKGSLDRELKRREKFASDQLERLYRDAPDTSQVLKENNRPLRVVTISPQNSAYQRFCSRDITAALNAQGVQASEYIGHSKPGALLGFLNTLIEEQPDIVFVMSKDRSVFKELPRNLPILAWDQDYACVHNPGLAENMGPHDRLVTLVAEWCDIATNAGAKASQVGHLNLGANIDVFTPPKQHPKPDYDVLFVGNIHPFETYAKTIGFDKTPKPVQEIMLHARDRLYNWVRTQDEDAPFVIPAIEPFVQESADALGHTIPADANIRLGLCNYFRYRIAHYVLRQTYVESLADFKLGLFGNGWDQIEAVAHHAQPPIENGAPMLDAMHRSAIHLQLHTWTVHHPRLYDTAAAAGFLLVGNVPEQYTLDNVFTPGEELDTFGSIAQLKNKIRYYLDHPQQRQAMAAKAADRVMREHTMAQRMTSVMEYLRHDPTQQHS